MIDVIDCFKYCDNPKYSSHGETAVIEIVKGNFKGMIYQYERVGFKDISPKNMECKFDYITIREADNEYLVASEIENELEKFLGDILICILSESLDNGGGIMDGKNRNNDTEEFTTQ